MEESGTAPENNTGPAPNAQLPICTDPNTIKYVRVAVHFFLSEQEFIERTFEDDCLSGASVTRTYFGPGNFTEYGDGNGSVSYNGFNRAEDIVANANAELTNNATQGRKTPGEFYPATPPVVPVRYILVGTYFHRDNDAYNYTVSPEAVTHPKYDIDGDQVLDILWGGGPISPGRAMHSHFLMLTSLLLSMNIKFISNLDAGNGQNQQLGVPSTMRFSIP